ncbi:MAG: nuclear transport factor 2 family protein [Pseudomonadota bacterium]|nr:nuclear transport factor 2 family protein [Pseudomonadota bacterium]
MAADNCELIESLEHEWRDALCGKDWERLRALVHPRFILIGTRATGPFTMNRDEWLEAIQRRELIDIDLKVTDAVVMDQLMVGTVEATWRLSYVGREVEDSVLLTDVWLCEDGCWQVVRRHSTPVPA